MQEHKIIKFCPKCGSTHLKVEVEPGQHTLLCLRCNFYCEIFIFDEGDFDELDEPLPGRERLPG